MVILIVGVIGDSGLPAVSEVSSTAGNLQSKYMLLVRAHASILSVYFVVFFISNKRRDETGK